MKDVETTVIGSYPVNIDNLSLVQSYFNQEKVSWKRYIDQAIDDMMDADLDMISDGQTRDPFVHIFARKLRGCRIRDRIEVIGPVQHVEPITLDDIKYVKKRLGKNFKILGLIVGPFTLTKSCVDNYYGDEKELAFDFASALKKEISLIDKFVDMISIDEPFFSNEMPDYANDLITKLTKNTKARTRLHVCGDVSNILPMLIDINVDVLSHEFKATPKLFDAFKDYLGFNQDICLGSVRSDNIRVESIEEITNHINKGIEIFDDKIKQIAPDCGLRMLNRKSARKKLENMVKAKSDIYG